MAVVMARTTQSRCIFGQIVLGGSRCWTSRFGGDRRRRLLLRQSQEIRRPGEFMVDASKQNSQVFEAESCSA